MWILLCPILRIPCVTNSIHEILRPPRPTLGPTQRHRYRTFPGGRGGRGVGLTPHPHLVPKVLQKSKAVPLLTLRACVAYKKGENLLIASGLSEDCGKNRLSGRNCCHRCNLKESYQFHVIARYEVLQT